MWKLKSLNKVYLINLILANGDAAIYHIFSNLHEFFLNVFHYGVSGLVWQDLTDHITRKEKYSMKLKSFFQKTKRSKDEDVICYNWRDYPSQGWANLTESEAKEVSGSRCNIIGTSGTKETICNLLLNKWNQWDNQCKLTDNSAGK